MRSFIILLFITWLCPIGIWAQFNPNNPQEPSAEPPYANFSFEVYKLGVKFDNYTRNASRYEWDFGDGTTSTEKNPERLARILSGETPQGIPALVERIGKRLFTTHLQDNFGLNDDHQAPGIGYLDWPALIHSIRNTGYSGPLMMELTGNQAKIRRSVCQMRNFPLEKEIIFAASYLNFLDSQIGGLP